jgi:hypothetical protein
LRLKAKERKLKDGCDKSDLVDRKNKITEILIASKYPSANEFNGSVESFAKSNLKIEEIESLVRSTVRGMEFYKEVTNKPRAGVF